MKKYLSQKKNSTTSIHQPVMLGEVMEHLNVVPGKFIVDGTVDGGGHAAAILEKLEGRGTFLGIDWDRAMIARTERALAHFETKQLRLLWANDSYANLETILHERSLPKPDGIFLDLGFSTLQLETSGRGFSFLHDEPLLMTYSDALVPVRRILREKKEEELMEIIRDFGGERFARRIAHAIKERSRKKTIETSGELAEIIREALPANYERGRIHPATRTFQGLRIYANHELENLEAFLNAIPDILARAGRIVIISFHSLEDRLVKNYFRMFAKDHRLTVLTKKPISASREEVIRNPKSRSAKLRAAFAL